MKPLSELIQEAQQALEAIASHEDYAQMRDGDFLVGLDFTQADCLHFLTQLSQAYEDFTLLDDPVAEEMGCSRVPSFDELFGPEALDNPLQIPEKRKLTLTEIMQRPLPPITPEMQAELADLEELFHGENNV